MSNLPKEIERLVGNQAFVRNEVGQSGSEVRIYPKHVLKIQPQTAETDNERDISVWVDGMVPLPKMEAYCVENGTAYTFMTKVEGEMLCTEELLEDIPRLVRLTAEGLQMLWRVDVGDCPITYSRLDERLKTARRNLAQGLVDTENVEPETYGPDGFGSPLELLEWLEKNRPEEDLVLTHGDFCLPNLFWKGGRETAGSDEKDHISGFIDIGKMGPADRWQDIAIAIRSLEANISGIYANRVYGHFEPQMLLDELGIEMDEKKYFYYKMLDELF